MKNCAYNQRRLRSDNKTGTRGVYFDKKRGRYQVTITIHTRRIHLGWFVSKRAAIHTRQSAERMFVGFL